MTADLPAMCQLFVATPIIFGIEVARDMDKTMGSKGALPGNSCGSTYSPPWHDRSTTSVCREACFAAHSLRPGKRRSMPLLKQVRSRITIVLLRKGNYRGLMGA